MLLLRCRAKADLHAAAPRWRTAEGSAGNSGLAEQVLTVEPLMVSGGSPCVALMASRTTCGFIPYCLCRYASNRALTRGLTYRGDRFDSGPRSSWGPGCEAASWIRRGRA